MININKYREQSNNKINNENELLNVLKWDESQKQFIGTLIYNVIKDGVFKASITCNRNEELVSVVYTNENEIKSKILFNKNNNSFYTKDDFISDDLEVKSFLENISNVIKDEKAYFRPIKRIKQENSFKFKN